MSFGKKNKIIVAVEILALSFFKGNTNVGVSLENVESHSKLTWYPLYLKEGLFFFFLLNGQLLNIQYIATPRLRTREYYIQQKQDISRRVKSVKWKPSCNCLKDA